MSRAVKGVTLLEMMVALVVGGVVLTLAFGASVDLVHYARGRGERAGEQATLRTIVAASTRELEPLGADSIGGIDVGALTAGSVAYRAHRGLYVACRIAPDTIVLAPGRTIRWSSRLPAAVRDSVLIYAGGDSTAAIDAWYPAPLVAGPNATSCPSGEPGLSYHTVLDSTTIARHKLTSETLIRVFESAILRLYGATGSWQFGFEGLSAGATIQPVAGPLQPTGVDFAGWTAIGAPSTTPSAVAGFDLVVRAATHRELAVGGWSVATAVDSAATSLRLRNVQ